MGRQINYVSRFSKRLILISLFFETILPYLKTKLTKYLYQKSNDSNMHMILLKIVKLLDKIAQILIFIYQFKYMVDPDLKYFKPYFQMFGIAVR
jgi:hypothetical protein